jgi:diguanylate cyclase (GGDEF)-like protein
MNTQHKGLYIGGFLIMLLVLAGNLFLFSRISLLKDDASVINLLDAVMGGIQRSVKAELGGRNSDLFIHEIDKSLALLGQHADVTSNGELSLSVSEAGKDWGRLKELLVLYRKDASPELREQILVWSESLWDITAKTVRIVQSDAERRVKLFYFLIPNIVSILILLIFAGVLGRLYIRNRLLHLATHDTATGALNPVAFHYILQQYLLLSDRYERPSSLIMFSLDGYDRLLQHGKEKTDKVLFLLVELVQRSTRRTDIVVRLGADRFGLLLPETDLPRAVKIAEKLRTEVIAFHFGPEPLAITAGVTQLVPGESPEIFLGRAESALKKAEKDEDKRIGTL